MLIILDRDGVINYESTAYIKCPAEWIPIPGSLEAIARLNRAGHCVVIMTNQAGVGRGYYDEAMLANIHEKLHSELAKVGGAVANIYYCPHHPDDNCDCRKPKPGMLQAIARDFPSEWPHRLVIGDSWRDVEAARAMQCEAWLVLTGVGQECVDAGQIPADVPLFADLNTAVDVLLKRSGDN